MRATLPKFNYYAPLSLDEVVNLMENLDNYLLLAGGTDIIPGMRLGKVRPGAIISLKNLKRELSYIRLDGEIIKVGALTSLRDIEKSKLIKEKAPVLYEAVSQMASIQVRNMATIGGNLCNASPAADTALPLLILDAEAVGFSPSGERSIPMKDFFLGPGKTALRRNEVLKEVRFTPEQGGAMFLKIGRRRGEDIAVASAASLLKVEDSKIVEARVALGSVAPTPMRAYGAEKLLKGEEPSDELFEKAASKAAAECSPITDVRASAEYRRKVVKVLVKRSLKGAFERGKRL